MPDHVHMLVSIPPKISVSSFMGYLKGKSALMMFDRHANLKYKFGNRHFWSEWYYVSTVGLNEATIRKYIQEQEKADMIKDKLSAKEYEDPFTGGGDWTRKNSPAKDQRVKFVNAAGRTRTGTDFSAWFWVLQTIQKYLEHTGVEWYWKTGENRINSSPFSHRQQINLTDKG